MDNSVPALTGGDLLHLDGQCFVGDAGVLGVALTSGTLARLRRSAAPTHWLLPVENPAIAAATFDLPGEVLWLCSRPAGRVLGDLVADFNGAWFDGDEVVIQLDSERHHLRMERTPNPAFALAYLGRLVTRVWTESPVASLSHHSFATHSRLNILVA